MQWYRLYWDGPAREGRAPPAEKDEGGIEAVECEVGERSLGDADDAVVFAVPSMDFKPQQPDFESEQDSQT